MKKEYASIIGRDLRYLKIEKGYRFTGVVSDGGTGIRKAIWKELGSIPHQICMAHVHRSLVAALRKKPKDYRVQKLKQLSDHLWLIESKEALKWWKEKLQDWIKENREYLFEYRRDNTERWWYIHKGVRKATRVLVSVPDTCFTFLNHPTMPRATNKIEGSISMLSAKHLVHRGLKRERIQPFIKWFIYFYNKRLVSQRKTKEV